MPRTTGPPGPASAERLLTKREMESPVAGGASHAGVSTIDPNDEFPIGASAAESGVKYNAASLDQAEADVQILANTEGFEFFVFLPQLIMRLCPPLMLLQLIPDYRPRADLCLFSLGVSAMCAGATKSPVLGCGVLLTTISCPAVAKAIWICAKRRHCGDEQREGDDIPHQMKFVLFAAGIAAILNYVVRLNTSSREIFGDERREKSCSSWGCLSAFAGVVTVLVVLIVWAVWAINWAIYRDWSETSEFKTRISTWSKPHLRLLSDLFVERFPLGELQVSQDKLKRSLAGSVWEEVVDISLDTKLYKDDKVKRLKQICKHTDKRWGLLRPTRVQKVEKIGGVSDDGDAWTLNWEQYSSQKHGQLQLAIKYNDEFETIQLKKASVHSPADVAITDHDRHTVLVWSHQGGHYATGYRVFGGLSSNADGVEGDYLNNLKSSSEREPRRLEFTQQSADQLGKRKLLHLSPTERRSSYGDRQMRNGFWVIAAPQRRITVSSGGMDYDRDKYETLFEAEQQAEPRWTESGPPSGVNGQWASPSGREQIGRSRPASPEPDPERVQPEPEPEPETLKVHGFVRAEYEIVFPRRLDLTFQTWLGATVRASDHVEFQILQIENFLWSSFQLVAIMLMMQVYALNTQDFVSRSGDDTQIFWFWTSKELWVDLWPGSLSVEFVRSTFMSTDDQSRGMRLEESEVLLPAVMYIFLCFVGASEHAMFSGMDTLSESREDRWYRRAEKSWRDAKKQKKPCSCHNCTQHCTVVVANRKGHFIVAVPSMLFGVMMSIWAFIIHHDQTSGLHAIVMLFSVVLLILATLVLADALDIARTVKDGLYQMLLQLFLFCTDKVCTDGQQKEPRNFEWFSRHVNNTDLFLRTSFRLDKRDEMRKHELTLTYIEAPMWSEYREDGPSGFKTHFEQVDDAVIYSDIIELRQKMKVFKMDLPESSSSGSELVRTPSPAQSNRRFLRGTSVFHGTLTEFQKTLLGDEDTCMSVGHIADMIIYLSKARRLVHARRTTLICLAVSLMHAAVPFWHAWLPKKLGGQCGVDRGCVMQWQCHSTVLGVPFDAGMLLACSSSLAHVKFHLLCAAVNLTLTYAILNRLFKCQADYYARYCHMLYFIQLTPWSNLQHHHLKDHWGLLPTFDLNTPGNIEAWNKLRLYLQSAQIKSSRFKQVSVLWCFCAVVLMVVVKVAEVVLVASRKVTATDCTTFFEGKDPGEQCNKTIGCQWVASTATDSGQNNQTLNHCQEIKCEKITDESRCTLDASNQWCTWNFGHQQCERAEQHFDTMSLFVVAETLIFGVGLIYTLWQGMKSNEIKQEGFPYVVRMKYSELLSNAMNFVSERAYWETHKQSWRTAEVELLSIAKKLKSVQSVETPAGDKFQPIVGTAAQQQQQLHAMLLKKSKGSAVDKLEELGFYSFITSNSSSISHPQKALAKQLLDANLIGIDGDKDCNCASLDCNVCRTKKEHAEKYATDLVNEGCTTLDMLQKLVKVHSVGSDTDLSLIDEWEKKTLSIERSGLPQITDDHSASPAAARRRGPSSLQELSKARYPFGKAENRKFTNPAAVKFDRVLDARLNLGPRRADDSISPSSDSSSAGQLQTPTGKLEDELAAVREQVRAIQQALHEGQKREKADADQARCAQMLKNLANTLDEEYSEGGRAHWGSEDRRTKMWFINLSRPLLSKLFVAVVGQLMVAVVGILLKYLEDK